MTILLILAVAIVVLWGGGTFYSRFIARSIGEQPGRAGPAIDKADGRDFVPTPTPIVFAHHFASIAGAGPIIGPVIAVIYGWGPALAWVLLGGVLIGSVHDYLATYMATREGGQSIATVARRILGKDAFIALTLFLVLMLALVCAAFLNASATALTSMLPFERIGLSEDQSLFRVVDNKVVIGGIASMSVIVITVVAPLLGWLYIKKKVSVWVCSLMAIGICAASVTIGLYFPLYFPAKTELLGFTFAGSSIWKFILSSYVLVAAGVPVWIFLQSRDFINVHILYVGMLLLVATLAVAGLRGAEVADPIPMVNLDQGTAAKGPAWPMLFILIACGAVSGFHSLCGGGTTCKQIKTELDARRVGYNAMLLESFLAVCVIGVLLVGASHNNYLADVHPAMVGMGARGNPILGFAMAVGNAGHLAWGVPIAVGALAGMVLLEGFLVTTLDTAIRLTRYLVEEIWRTLFEKYDVFAAPVAEAEARVEWATGEAIPAGSDGIPVAPDPSESPPAPAHPKPTSGLFRSVLLLMRTYWFNSGIAVALMLVFALSGGVGALWGIFATSNQLLAAMVLALATLWLMKRGKRFWFALIPAIGMLATTITALIMLLQKFSAKETFNPTLLTANIVIMAITGYLLFVIFAGIREHIIGRMSNKAPKA